MVLFALSLPKLPKVAALPMLSRDSSTVAEGEARAVELDGFLAAR